MYFTGSSGTQSASANFDLSGNTLTITVTNTSTADVLIPGDVLTGVFFNTAHTLTPDSATLNGSTVENGSIIHSVGEGWQYQWFSSGLPHGMDSGISATGLGLFGPSGNFDAQPVQLGGIDYGIVSAGDNPGTGNTGVSHGPLINDSIAFTLTVPNGFSLSELGDTIVFQYGSSLSELSITGTDPPAPAPEPASIVLWTAALAGLVLGRRPKRA